jgi:uncharacterized membrane protein YhhN
MTTMDQHKPDLLGKLALPVLVLALLVGGSYVFSVADGDVTPLGLAWKGGGVWLLSVHCALKAKTIDGWLITAVMALSAAGDVLVEKGLENGALAFAAAHVVAIGLYARNRRASLTVSQLALACLVVPLSCVIAWSLPADRTGLALLVVYTMFVSMMAALAWSSRFPRYRTGIGAMLFLISDLFIFAQMGPLAEAGWVAYLVWITYFAGQVLIVLGVTQTLDKDKPVGLQAG